MIVVLDRSEALSSDDDATARRNSDAPTRLVVANKSDRSQRRGRRDDADARVCHDGRAASSELRRRLSPRSPAVSRCGIRGDLERAAHRRCSTGARRISRSAQAAAEHGGMSEEFVLADCKLRVRASTRSSATRTSEDVLRHIFERFCIGK